MKTTYYFKSEMPQTEDKILYTAKNGKGFIANNELHIIAPGLYWVYKFLSERWYSRNDIAGTDHYIGMGACPTITLENIKIKDEDYWGQITYDPNQREE